MTNPVTLIRSTQLFPDVPYAYAATAPAHTRIIALAGACPLDTDGRIVASGDYAGQARKCVDNLIVALSEAGAAIDNILSTRVLVASQDRSDLSIAWQIVHRSFADHEVPSTLLGVTVLGYEEQLVEVEAIAAVREEASSS